MKFPYIPISYIIADVRAEFKRMNNVGEITDENCIPWIIEVMREIGGANYPTESIVIDVCNNVGQLPSNFYVVDQIWLCGSPGIPTKNTIWFTKEGVCYPGISTLFPGDVMTGTTLSKYSKYGAVPRGANTYIIRHPYQLRCSLPEAKIGLIYVAMPTNESGDYLIQDEINTLKAAKAYVKKMLLSERYYLGEVTENIWQNISREYDQHVDQAQAIFKFPDPADDEARGIWQDHRYDAFKLD